MLAAPDFPEFTVGVGDVELKRLYLFSRLHGLGAGQAMMELALRHATAAGAKRMLIGVHRANARALAFYGRNGFNEVGVRTFKLGSVMFDDLILGRML